MSYSVRQHMYLNMFPLAYLQKMSFCYSDVSKVTAPVYALLDTYDEMNIQIKPRHEVYVLKFYLGFFISIQMYLRIFFYICEDI